MKLLYVLLLVLLAGCSDSLVSPTVTDLPPVSLLPQPPGVPRQPRVSPLSDCAYIGIDRQNVSVSTDGLTATFYVPARNADYVDVWLPRVNDGQKRGPNPVNEEFALTFSKYGRYEYQLSVEKVFDEFKQDKLIQCDVHHGSFELRK